MSNTDTNQASELYELCKKVYELTGWAISKSDKGEVGSYDSRIKYYRLDGFMQDSPLSDSFPQFTSDYLLGKLREMFEHLGETDFGVYYLQDHNKWEAELIKGRTHECFLADTPLKALLKLVIALSEAGELDNE